MPGFDPQYTEQRRRDGWVTGPQTEHVTSTGRQFAAGSLAGLKDASAIREQLDRIQPMTSAVRCVRPSPKPSAGFCDRLWRGLAGERDARRAKPASAGFLLKLTIDDPRCPGQAVRRQLQQAKGPFATGVEHGDDVIW